MIDVAFLAVPALITVAVMVKKTSAGVALLSLLAGVMLDQILTTWIIDQLPDGPGSIDQFLPVAIRIVVSFAPMVASLVAVKVHKHNAILSLLASLLLGFLAVYFGGGILEDLPAVSKYLDESSLMRFLMPYKNAIIAASAVLAVVEMVASHRTSISHGKKKKKD